MFSSLPLLSISLSKNIFVQLELIFIKISFNYLKCIFSPDSNNLLNSTLLIILLVNWGLLSQTSP